MQLKMAKPFNAELAKQIVQREERFITNMFSNMPLPITEQDENDEDYENNGQEGGKPQIVSTSGKAKRAQSFEELQQKLDSLKGQKKLDHKQKLVKKNLKNRLKKKSKREERLMQKKMLRTEQNAAGGARIKTEDAVEGPKVSRAKPVFNAQGNMVFSKFDFSEIGTKKKPPKSEKDPKKALELLQQKKQKIKELEEAGEKEKAQEIKEKEAWKTALAKASGEKVKDDPDLLKRTIKRGEQQKTRSSKKWESRIEGVAKAKQEKQDKRQENILKRKKDKKTNKLKKASKRGRVIAGF